MQEPEKPGFELCNGVEWGAGKVEPGSEIGDVRAFGACEPPAKLSGRDVVDRLRGAVKPWAAPGIDLLDGKGPGEDVGAAIVGVWME